MGETKRVRVQFTRSSAWLRRARRHFYALCRPWAEEETDPAKYRERVWKIGRVARDHGLRAACSCEHDLAYSVILSWKRDDGMSFWPWIHAEKRREVARMFTHEFQRWKEDRGRRRRTA